MKIGKVTVPHTSICTSDEHTVAIRGRDLSKELIGKVSFVEHFFLLLTGKLPGAGEAAVLNATLVAIAEHGLVPSVQAARMTFAAAPKRCRAPSRPASWLRLGRARFVGNGRAHVQRD